MKKKSSSRRKQSKPVQKNRTSSTFRRRLYSINAPQAPTWLSLIILAALVVIAAWLFTYKINRPWIGLHDFNGAVWSNIARNFNRYGFIATKLGQVDNFGPQNPESFNFYIHHPPLLPILLALMFRLFGESETVARSLPILFSLGALVLTFLIAKYFWGVIGAVISAVALIATPHYHYFGKMVDHEALTFFFILSAVYFYARWRDDHKRLNLGLFLGMLAGGGLSGWPAYYFMGVITVLDIILEKRLRKEILLVPALGLVLFGGFLIHVAALKGGSNVLIDLKDILKLRTGQISGPRNSGFTWLGFWDRIYFRLLNEFTWSLLVLACSGIITLAVLRTQKAKRYLALMLGLLAVALIHIFVFRHGAWNHDYWFYYLLAPLVLSAAALGSFSFNKQWQNYASLAFGALFLTGLIFQSLQVTKFAYEAGPEDTQRVVLGKAINQNTQFRTLVMADLAYLGPQGSYYADRNLVLGINTVKKFNKAKLQYRDKDAAFVEIKVPAELRETLERKYDREKLGDTGLRIFRIHGGR